MSRCAECNGKREIIGFGGMITPCPACSEKKEEKKKAGRPKKESHIDDSESNDIK